MKKPIAILCLLTFVAAATLGAFNGGAWGALGIGGGILFLTAACLIDGKYPPPPRSLSILMAATLGLWALELPVSSDVALSARTWLHLASIFIPLIWLAAPRAQQLGFSPRFVSVIAAAMAAGALALGAELASGGVLLHALRGPNASLTEYNRGIAHLVILSFPVLAALWHHRRRAAALALALALLFPASLTDSHTAKLALILGVAVTGFGFWQPVWTRRALAAGAVVILPLPFYAQRIFSDFYARVETWHPSWTHRMEIWDYLSYRIAERPLLGWGLGTTHTLDVKHPHGNLYHYATAAAPHAHNFVTQLWVETGLPGLGCGLALMLLALRGADKLSSSLRPFALGGWTAAVVTASFGFDFWTDALWAAFALSAFVFGMLQQQDHREPDLVDA
ncbi:MAG: O-antigen ligase family protein [Alphaproteobacteria bacterium]|nr:O-antigen ligase family protein [Alphaproteobacteria bacterium]